MDVEVRAALEDARARGLAAAAAAGSQVRGRGRPEERLRDVGLADRHHRRPRLGVPEHAALGVDLEERRALGEEARLRGAGHDGVEEREPGRVARVARLAVDEPAQRGGAEMKFDS